MNRKRISTSTMRGVAALSLLVASMISSPAFADGAGEYFWNNDPGTGRATAIRLSSTSDGYMSSEIDASGLPAGINFLGLRANTGGRWSPTVSYMVAVQPAASELKYKAEYYWDADPGMGRGTAIELPADGVVDILALSVPAEGLAPGYHTLGIRVGAQSGWSQTATATVHVADETTYEIVAVEYFWGDDPGAGKGTPVEVTPGATVDLSHLSIDFPAEEAEEYVLSFRARTAKAWGPVHTTVIPHLYVTSIALASPEEPVIAGSSIQIAAEVMPEDAFNPTLRWESSDSTVATVDERGMLTGVSEG